MISPSCHFSSTPFSFSHNKKLTSLMGGGGRGVNRKSFSILFYYFKNRATNSDWKWQFVLSYSQGAYIDHAHTHALTIVLIRKFWTWLLFFSTRFKHVDTDVAKSGQQKLKQVKITFTMQLALPIIIGPCMCADWAVRNYATHFLLLCLPLFNYICR